MSKAIAFIVGFVLLVVLLLFSMTFTVRYNEIAIRTRFGKTSAESVVTEPGLKFKLPLFADKITTLDTRLQLRESPRETIQTTDGQQVIVQAFLLWQVDVRPDHPDGPLKFFTSHPGGVEEANQRLSDQFRTALRTGLSKYSFDDLIGTNSRLGDAEQTILDEMMSAQARGIDPKSVGISQLILPPKTTTAVLRRMEATRSYLSEAERYKGNSEATGIESRAKYQSEKIRAFANQRAEEIRAAGNKDAAKYIELMGQDVGLAVFLSWLDGLQDSLSDRTTLIVPTEFAPFHLLRLDTLTDSRGIPQPIAEDSRLKNEKRSVADAQRSDQNEADASPKLPATPADAQTAAPGGS